MELLNVKGVAAIFKLSTRQIWKLLEENSLPQPVRLGRSVRWRRADIDSFIANGCSLKKSQKTLQK